MRQLLSRLNFTYRFRVCSSISSEVAKSNAQKDLGNRTSVFLRTSIAGLVRMGDELPKNG